MLELKLVKVGPRVPQIRLNLHGSLEPLTSLCRLPLSPKQPTDREKRDIELNKQRHAEDTKLKSKTVRTKKKYGLTLQLLARHVDHVHTS